ncbi:MAG: MFS transporter [Betaproteobacteria bacterium]|nr:MFS transporter [Pseudomonadota bacterium]NBO44229.1 MFS transporter [Betaproteobacteria bacterium]NBS21031.1 MFS transporter [Betaproteobacteria bacterium]NBU01055.1 MFS transporter [Betaproteobacteria bacterium]NBU66265.1 MFS transporter [Betaproteobacteria bacterium]
MIQSLRFQLGLLATLQALLLTNNVTLVAVNGLAGYQLASEKWMATLPVTGYVLGGAVWAMPAALFMRRFGRASGYALGSLVAVLGAVITWYAVSKANLWLLCLGTFVCGLYNAFAQSYRFAAADLAEAKDPGFKAKAISLVLTGGIVGGVLGPELANWSRSALDTAFAGSYLSLAGFAVLSFVLSFLLRLPETKLAAEQAGSEIRPLAVVLRQPAVVLAILSASIGYGVMNLLMVATPLAMEICGHSWPSTTLVLEWHVIGMFAPGLVTGSLISRFGVMRMLLAGVALNLMAMLIALTGTSVSHFLVSMALIGVGWNFMYTGGTTLLTQSYSPAEKNKVQGFMDMAVFCVMVSSSLSSGALHFLNGWSLLNLIAIPLVGTVLLYAAWLSFQKAPPKAA